MGTGIMQLMANTVSCWTPPHNPRFQIQRTMCAGHVRKLHDSLKTPNICFSRLTSLGNEPVQQPPFHQDAFLASDEQCDVI